jgi:hypothetical protein
LEAVLAAAGAAARAPPAAAAAASGVVAGVDLQLLRPGAAFLLQHVHELVVTWDQQQQQQPVQLFEAMDRWATTEELQVQNVRLETLLQHYLAADPFLAHLLQQLHQRFLDQLLVQGLGAVGTPDQGLGAAGLSERWLHALRLGVSAGEANVLSCIVRGQQQQQQQQQGVAAAAAAAAAGVMSHQLLQLSALYDRLFTVEVTAILSRLQFMQQQQQQQQQHFAALQAWIANTGMITAELLSLVARIPASIPTGISAIAETIMFIAVRPAAEAAAAAAAAADAAVDAPAVVSPVVEVASATTHGAAADEDASLLPQQQQQQGSSMSEVQGSWQQLLEGQLPVSMHLPLHRMVAQCVKAVMDYSLASAAPQQQQQQLCQQLWALDWQGLAQHVLLTHAWLVQVRLTNVSAFKYE